MKRTIYLAIGLICSIYSNQSYAQSTASKTARFANYPKIMYCNAAAISKLFTIKQGEQAVLNFNDQLSFKGAIVRKISKFNNTLQTLAIQLPELDNSILLISKRTATNNSEVFIGHLYNNKFSEGFQLIAGKNGEYEMVKIAVNQVMQPCNL